MENYEKSKSGNVRAVCRMCGAKSKWVRPESDGQPDVFDMKLGWSMVPHSLTHVHADGSRGTYYYCPACNLKRRRG